jgi:ABC-type bacteriocin/lantibiotic exporter with double-glycine peptidase domain
MSVAAIGVSAARASFGRQLTELVRSRQRILMIIALLVLIGALFELLPPLLIRWIVDDHLAVGKSEGLLMLALCYLGAMALGQGLAFVYGYLAAATCNACRRAISTTIPSVTPSAAAPPTSIPWTRCSPAASRRWWRISFAW